MFALPEIGAYASGKSAYACCSIDLGLLVGGSGRSSLFPNLPLSLGKAGPTGSGLADGFVGWRTAYSHRVRDRHPRALIVRRLSECSDATDRASELL